MFKDVVADHGIYRGIAEGNLNGAGLNVLNAASVAKEGWMVQGHVDPDDPAGVGCVTKAALTTAQIHRNLIGSQAVKDVIHGCWPMGGRNA